MSSHFCRASRRVQAGVFALLICSITSGSSADANDRHVELIARTPCLEAYRVWAFGNRRTPFKTPIEHTEKECSDAARLNELIQEEAYLKSVERSKRLQEAAAREEARAERDRRAQRRQAKDAMDRRAAMPGVRIGMTAEDVRNRSSWGPPSSVNRTTTATGTREFWHYGGRNSLMLEHGVVVVINH